MREHENQSGSPYLKGCLLQTVYMFTCNTLVSQVYMVADNDSKPVMGTKTAPDFMHFSSTLTQLTLVQSQASGAGYSLSEVRKVFCTSLLKMGPPDASQGTNHIAQRQAKQSSGPVSGSILIRRAHRRPSPCEQGKIIVRMVRSHCGHSFAGSCACCSLEVMRWRAHLHSCIPLCTTLKAAC